MEKLYRKSIKTGAHINLEQWKIKETPDKETKSLKILREGLKTPLN